MCILIHTSSVILSLFSTKKHQSTNLRMTSPDLVCFHLVFPLLPSKIFTLTHFQFCHRISNNRLWYFLLIIMPLLQALPMTHLFALHYYHMSSSSYFTACYQLCQKTFSPCLLEKQDLLLLLCLNRYCCYNPVDHPLLLLLLLPLPLHCYKRTPIIFIVSHLTKLSHSCHHHRHHQGYTPHLSYVFTKCDIHNRLNRSLSNKHRSTFTMNDMNRNDNTAFPTFSLMNIYIVNGRKYRHFQSSFTEKKTFTLTSLPMSLFMFT